MAHLSAPDLQTAFRPAAPHAAQEWQLDAGRALALRAREATELTVAQGMLWATLDGPHVGPLNDRGDVVLQAGERLLLAAGQRVLIESISAAGREPVRLSWTRQPRRYGVLRVLAPLRVALPAALRGVLTSVRAARAASNASRAQGAIACGESIASSGAL